MKINRLSIIIHFAVVLLAAYILYIRYIRFILADNEAIAIAMLNPNRLPLEQPVLFSLIMLAIVLVFYVLLRLKPSSSFLARLMKAFYGYSIAVIILQLLVVLMVEKSEVTWNQVQFESKNLFVQVEADDTRIRAEPSLTSKVLKTVEQGTLLLLNDVKKVNDNSWNRVLLSPKKYGWIVRVATVGSGEKKRLTRTNKFYFTIADQVSLILAFIGFIWGFLSYRKER